MELVLPVDQLERYTSFSQRARIATETWGAGNLYCPNCDSDHLARTPPNAPSVDFFCPRCRSPFQLKSQGRPLSSRVTDAAYGKMRQAIMGNRTPNLFVLHYDRPLWKVCDLLLIPHFAFSLSAIEQRRPLGPKARRAGWIGCNILLDRIPADAKIPIVAAGTQTSELQVRRSFARLRPIQALGSEMRGWTLDVLTVVRSLRKASFSLAEVYAFDRSLAELHPNNRNIRAKIRQQLQLLRDLGLLQFLGQGIYRLN
jgi:type II restriction enzyme